MPGCSGFEVITLNEVITLRYLGVCPQVYRGGPSPWFRAPNFKGISNIYECLSSITLS
ncbi:unnamed protein product [Meloidogyne enterolobii]|uniref:Uncharacterized protein n=1 Tax=Meloidogyne enterolobii TaxID=390850 RepID=A0ACB0ZH90_MELEN